MPGLTFFLMRSGREGAGGWAVDPHGIRQGGARLLARCDSAVVHNGHDLLRLLRRVEWVRTSVQDFVFPVFRDGALRLFRSKVLAFALVVAWLAARLTTLDYA